MRLFGKIDSTIDRFDRTSFWGPAIIFDLASAESTTPKPPNVDPAFMPNVFGSPGRIGLIVRSSYNGPVMADFTAVESFSFTTNMHGFADGSGFLPMELFDAFRFYNLIDPPHIELHNGTYALYEGRVEDFRISNGGLGFTAYGYYRAYDDLKINAVYSDTSLGEWYPLTDGDDDYIIPDRYAIDKFKRLHMAPSKDGEFSDTNAHASFGYRVPDLSWTQIEKIRFNYEMKMATGWRAVLQRCDEDWNVLSTVWTLDGDGTLLSGTQTVDLTACDALRFTLFYNNSTPLTYAGETGDEWLDITTVRVFGLDSDPMTVDVILKDIIAKSAIINPSQINDDTNFVISATFDLEDIRFEDMRVTDALDMLTRYSCDGDNCIRHPAVWDNRRMEFSPVGFGVRTWYVDVVRLEVEKSMAANVNNVYAVFNERGRGNRRTDFAETSEPFSVVRQDSVDAGDTTSEALAENYRDAYLYDQSLTRPRATIETEGLYDSAGTPHPLYSAKAGDTLVLRNMPPAFGDLDGMREFVIGRTTYDAVRNTLVPEPETPVPSLAVLIARQEGK